MTKYTHPEAGEPTILYLRKRRGGKIKSVMYEACCDCGLVHRRELSIENGRIVERVWRDDRRTAGIRRGKAKREEIGAVKKSNAYVIILRMNAKKRRRRVTVKYKPV